MTVYSAELKYLRLPEGGMTRSGSEWRTRRQEEGEIYSVLGIKFAQEQ